MNHFSRLNRRQFLALTASTTGAILLSQCSADSMGEQLQSLAAVHSSRDGLLELDLQASYRQVNLGGEQAFLLTYNGQIPGPRLEAKPGDRVRLHFTNKLSQPTNLHYHGLHVSPTDKADNVFLSLPSGESFTYEFTIPQNHPGGIFYYHPHLHEFVAEQVFGGLGGPFIIRGELDEIPEIKAAKDVLLFLKDFDLNASGSIQQPWHMAQMLGREGPLVTVNGQVNPTLSFPQGGLLRLRLLNASSSRFYRLALEDHPFYLIATDGNSLAEPVELRELLLVPGQRAEVLVRGEREPNRYRLLSLPYNRGGMGMMGRGLMGRGLMGRTDGASPIILATLTYSGKISPLPLPKQLILPEALPEAKRVRRFTLNHSMVPGRGMVFLINGKTYSHDPAQVDVQVRLNDVEDWEIVNTGVMDHPIHLHTNPFQVIARNGQPEPYRMWRDTILVPVGETVRVRVHFADFKGKTVYHCHIFDHEDLGMMGTLAIT